MDVSAADALYRDLSFHVEELAQDVHFLYLHQYEALCNAYDHVPKYSLCKVRLAKYFWGQYYSKYGPCTSAEASYIEALRTDAPDKTLQLLPDAKIQYQLLLVYHAENKTADLLPLLRRLMKLVNDERCTWMLNQTQGLAIYSVYNEYYNLAPERGYLDWLKGAVLTINRQRAGDEKGRLEALVTFTCTSTLLLAETAHASAREYTAYWDILKHFHDGVALREDARTLVLRTLIRLAPEVRLSAKAYVDELVQLLEGREERISANAELFQMAASFYFGAGLYDKGRTCLKRALEMITAEWHFDMRYFDKRAYQLLDVAQFNFLGCYDTIRKYMDISFAYEKVLQFKALASLAGRERNRLLFSGRIDQELMGAIRNAQDRIAWVETEKLFRDPSAESENDEAALWRLEDNFIRKYPSVVSFVDITLERVQRVLPNESAVVEYLFYETDHEKHEFSTPSQGRKTAIDIYLLRKGTHGCHLKRWTVSDGNAVLAQAQEFVSLLSDSKSAPERRKARLRKALYQKLIDPVLPDVNGIRSLYIAPDRELINLPFELLSDERCITLEEGHDIVRIECARDLLFSSAAGRQGTASLVMGNPQITIGSSKGALPFSESEAIIVGKHCACPSYTGTAATKRLLLSASAKGYRNIHIAAHGCFDNRGITEPMYSSALILAGQGNWVESGKMDPVYGNGVVTADEISRMDLQGVELVVLSTCWSGMNAILEDKGFHGLLGAFSAAGVRYVVSHLWAADDLGTAILMGFFYYYYTQQKQPPPAALNSAKRDLRNATISQLEKGGWFHLLQRSVPDQKAKDMVLNYQIRGARERPFAHETYWGGFACYQCN